MNLHKQLERALIGALDAKVKPIGFRRSGTLYRLDGADAIAMIWVQRSGDDVGEAYKFTINLGAYAECADDEPSINPTKLHFAVAQLRWRLGREQRGDSWWLIENEQQLTSAIEEILQLLNLDLEKLRSVSTTSGILRYFESGEFGGQSELGRDRILAALRARLSKTT